MGWLSDKVGVPFCIATGVVMIMIFGEYNDPIYHELIRTIDINDNGFPDPKEWEEVYKKFGLKYNVNSSDPLHDLSIEQMQEYIEMHQ